MKPTQIVLLATTAIIAASGGWIAARFHGTTEVHSAAATGTQRKVKFYQSPMHPWIKSDKPGKCTICGMDLVPVYEGEEGIATSDNAITLAAGTRSIIGASTSEVTRGPLVRTLRVAGVIDDDETRHRVLAARVPGRIEKLFVNQLGAEVAAGEPLATLYSPDVFSAQRIYIERVKSGPGAFTASERAESRERLLQLGLTEEDLKRLDQTLQPEATLTLRAPGAGTVVVRNAYEGQYVNAADRLFEIGDFSTLWFVFDAYESDLNWLRVGQSVEVTTPSAPDSPVTAPITFIDPNLVELTRTARVRVVLPNANRRLRHRQTATGLVRQEIPDTLRVPRSAVLFTQGEPIAYVDKGGDTYEPRSLKLGRVGDTVYEVESGLSPGERVVTEGALLLDSQAQLARTARGSAENAIPALVHDTTKLGSSEKMETVSPDIAALMPLVLASADAADSLSRDDLPGYAKIVPAIQSAFAAYVKQANDAAKGSLAEAVSKLTVGPDLKSARRPFEIFSTQMADVATLAGLQRSGHVFVFQCPMSPVLGTGRWIQKNDALRNPFFGSAMLECGEPIR